MRLITAVLGLLWTVGGCAPLPPAGSGSDGGERAFITDRYGERFDVTHAEQKYGMSRYGFEFGIGKNTIPPLDHPDMLAPGDPNYPSNWSRERIIGTKLGDETRSYPISPLSGHEIVNETFGNIQAAVAY